MGDAGRYKDLDELEVGRPPSPSPSPHPPQVGWALANAKEARVAPCAGEVQRDMGRYGETRDEIGRYGEIWGDTGRYGEIRGDT